MKIVCCSYGDVGFGNMIELLSRPDVDKSEIIVFTYDRKDNSKLIEFLTNMEILTIYDNINNCYDIVKSFNPDYIISMFYRHIIKKDILDLCGGKTLNVHPSLLPKYRGRFVTFWTIYNGDEFGGISYHYMDEKVDSGNIILQKKLKLSKSETSYSLYHKLANLCISNFNEAFDLLISGHKGTKQEEDTTHDWISNELPFGGVIKSNSVEEIERFTRAMYFPGKGKAYIELKSGDLYEFSKPIDTDEIKSIIMERIYSKIEEGKLLHFVNRVGEIDSVRKNVVTEGNFIQCATMKLPQGKTFKPHRHFERERLEKNYIPQESWVCIKGKVKCYFYDIDGTFLQSIILNPGDASFTLHGGHTYEILEDDTLVYEYKTGPYYGLEDDKIFLDE